MRGVDLRRAQLEGAHLFAVAELEGADLRLAHLKGADLGEAWLEGADLREANLAWVDLASARLAFADFAGVSGLETAELAGGDYLFADGLEGTILDINQPPPDVLPAP